MGCERRTRVKKGSKVWPEQLAGRMEVLGDDVGGAFELEQVELRCRLDVSFASPHPWVIGPMVWGTPRA